MIVQNIHERVSNIQRLTPQSTQSSQSPNELSTMVQIFAIFKSSSKTVVLCSLRVSFVLVKLHDFVFSCGNGAEHFSSQYLSDPKSQQNVNKPDFVSTKSIRGLCLPFINESGPTDLEKMIAKNCIFMSSS